MKRVIAYSIVFVSMIVFFSFSASAACINPNQTIITLYSQNNSHVAVHNLTARDSNAGISVCYDEIFGSDYAYANNNPWLCTGQNSIIGVYSQNNSHVASSANYNICYGDLSCQILTGSEGIAGCGSQKTIITISSMTNAHAAVDNSYAYKICCNAGTVVPPTLNPRITSANWTYPDSGNVMKVINSFEYVNITVRTADILNGNVINISIYNSSNNEIVYNNAHFTIINGQVNYKTNLSVMNATRNVGVGGQIYFNVTYTNSSGFVLSSVLSDNLTIVDYAITLAEWRDIKDGERTTNVLFGENVSVYGESNGLTGERVDVWIYYINGSKNILIENYPITLDSTGKVNITVNLSQLYYSSQNKKLVSGDRLFFLINNSNGSYKQSNSIKIGEDIIESGGCCEYITNEALCNATAPSNDGICKYANLNQTCSDRVLTKCTWDRVAGCTTSVVKIDAGGNEDGSCVTKYTTMDEQCIEGFRRISFEVIQNNATSCGGEPFCLDPCEGGVCTVPCRNVALLPFFSNLQLIASILLIVVGYVIFMRRR